MKSRLPTIFLSVCAGIGLTAGFMLITGAGQDIPGAGGLTRLDLAEMLYECDRSFNATEGYCVADVLIRPNDHILPHVEKGEYDVGCE